MTEINKTWYYYGHGVPQTPEPMTREELFRQIQYIRNYIAGGAKYRQDPAMILRTVGGWLEGLQALDDPK